MATRSIIAKTQPSGKIKASYCHFDGYPEHNGKILASYYTDKKKINALLAEGEISVLGHNIGKKIDFDDYQLCHALNQCRFYHRDRGEKLRKNTVEDASELEEYANDCNAEFVYLFKENKWHVLNVYNNGDFVLLESILEP